MALTLPADAGDPMSAILVADAQVKRHEFPALTRQVSLRNTGTNTLWISLDEGENFFDVACGTSWEDRASARDLWYCTQLGKTRFVVIGLALMSMDPLQPRGEDGEDGEDGDLERESASQRRRLLSRSPQNRR